MAGTTSTRRILILGGTREGRMLSDLLATDPRFTVTVSLAGRTLTPIPLPAAYRSGGFGGADGLQAFLEQNQIDVLVDATHPFATTIKANAIAATRQLSRPLLAIRRPAWTKQAGDRWIDVDDIAGAAVALGDIPRFVFLTIGRQQLSAFKAAPQHRYLIRSVDQVAPADALPNADYLLMRGSLSLEQERDLLQARRIEVIVAKNSGGDATYAKIEAARDLALPVIMVARPSVRPQSDNVQQVSSVFEAMRWLHHLPTPYRREV